MTYVKDSTCFLHKSLFIIVLNSVNFKLNYLINR